MKRAKHIFMVIVMVFVLQQDSPNDPNDYNCQLPSYAEQHAAECNDINSPFLLGGGAAATPDKPGKGNGGGLLGVLRGLL